MTQVKIPWTGSFSAFSSAWNVQNGGVKPSILNRLENRMSSRCSSVCASDYRNVGCQFIKLVFKWKYITQFPRLHLSFPYLPQMHQLFLLWGNLSLQNEQTFSHALGEQEEHLKVFFFCLFFPFKCSRSNITMKNYVYLNVAHSYGVLF